MIRSLPRISALQIVTVALLGAVLAASAGATCLFSAPVHSSSAGLPHTGCHSIPAPTKSRSHDMRCCVSSPVRALPTDIFPPQSAPQAIGADLVSVRFLLFSPRRNSVELPGAFASSGGPPTVTALRI
ncbi:MAG: hypothetical protein WA261_14755 [Candidatus Sulfotelmatobacter sp.]